MYENKNNNKINEGGKKKKEKRNINWAEFEIQSP